MLNWRLRLLGIKKTVKLDLVEGDAVDELAYARVQAFILERLRMMFVILNPVGANSIMLRRDSYLSEHAIVASVTLGAASLTLITVLGAQHGLGVLHDRYLLTVVLSV